MVLQKEASIDGNIGHYGIKLVPIQVQPNNLMKETFGITQIDTQLAYQTERPKELTANALIHPNIIKYLDHTFEIIDNWLFHLTGNF